MINYLKKWLNLNFYVSELDRFLQTYRKSHTQLSPSQEFEIKKYQTVYQKRDHSKANHNNNDNKSHFDELL